MTRCILAFFLACLLPVAAAAQDDDEPGFLEGLIERNLSSAGREVNVSGFEGALSSRATIEELTIADEQGVWLTLRGAVLDWSRSALLRGRLQVEALTAEEILVPRLPQTEPAPPSPEAQPFQLPELPVSVQIEQIAAERVVLGEPLFGARAEVSLDGSVSLAGGAGSAQLSVERIDEAEGQLTLDASYSNETNVLGLDLSLSEGPDGIAANLIGLPGRPSVTLSVTGEDPLSDFTADIALATDGAERVAGQVSLATTEPDGEGGGTARQFVADIAGDLAPVIAPDYRAFFGDEVSFVARGRSLPDGRLELERFTLDAAALSLSGTAAIAEDGLPESFDVSGELGSGTGATRLPVGGERILVDGASLSAQFDAAQGERWTLDMRAEGVERGDLVVDVAQIDGGGRISRGDGTTPRNVTAAIDYAVEGLTIGSPEVEEALGDTLSGRLEAGWEAGGPVEVTKLTALGAGLQLAAEGAVSEPAQGGVVSGSAELAAERLERFSALAGRELGGSGTLALSGEASLLGGGFDFTLDGSSQDLRVGVDALDRLLAGASSVSLAAVRDESGTELERFHVGAGELTADASGMLDSNAGDLRVDASLPEVGQVFPSLSGAASVGANVAWSAGTPVELTNLAVSAPGVSLSATGTVDPAAEALPVTGDLQLQAEGLERYADLARRPLSGDLEITADGSAELRGEAFALPGDVVTLPLGAFDLEVRGSGSDLGVGIAEVDRLLSGDSTFAVQAARDDSGIRLERFRLDAERAQLSANGALDGTTGTLRATANLPQVGEILPSLDGAFLAETALEWRQGAPVELTALTISAPGIDLDASGTVDPAAEALPVTGDLQLQAEGLERYSDLAGRPLSGDLEITANGSAELRGDAFALPGDIVTLPLGGFDLEVSGSGSDLGVGIAQVDRLLSGDSTFAVQAARDDSGIRLDRVNLDAERAQLSASGFLDETSADLQASASVPQVGEILPSLDGAFSAETAVQWREGAPVELTELTVSAPGVALEATGTLDPSVEALPASGKVTFTAESLTRYSEVAGRPLSGSVDLEAQGSGELRGAAFDVALDVTANDLGVGVDAVDRLLQGETVLSANVSGDGDTFEVAELDLQSPQLSFALSGQPETGLELDARLADVGLLVSNFSGPVTAAGTVRQEGETWQTELTATGPGGTSADIAGSVAGDASQVDLSVQGAAPLALANTFIEPRSLAGTANFDLAVQGPPGLSAVSGTISTQGASVALPTLGSSITGMGGTISLAEGTADLALDAQLDGTGQISVSGPLDLSPPFSSDLNVTLADVAVVDPSLYETTIDGEISLSGPLLSDGLIAGTLRLGETEIQVPSTGLGGRGDIPGLVHVNEPADVRETRRRAGLVETEEAEADGAGRPPLRLDLTILAENQIFVRGRGLDAELGGQLRIEGTVANVVPIGSFELIRGRLDILGERLTLTEGAIQLQGDFTPTIQLVAETDTGDIVVRIVVSGDVTEPDITFESDPELPQEEVLAQLLFGRDLTSLSPLQAAQLASAVATLAGRGGGGIISNLRESFGLADLDFTTDEEGNAAVRAGRYLSENIYTDVTVGSDGESEVNLNLDVSPSVTVKGSVGSSGDSGVGVFFERDY